MLVADAVCPLKAAYGCLRDPLLQALVGNYAVPILEDKQVWGTTDNTKTAYLDSLVRS